MLFFYVPFLPSSLIIINNLCFIINVLLELDSYSIICAMIHSIKIKEQNLPTFSETINLGLLLYKLFTKEEANQNIKNKINQTDK